MEKILVTKSSMPPLEEYINEIADMWDTHWLTNMGVKHTQFIDDLKSYLNVKNIELLTNGHLALELTLQSFGFKKGMEVITTPFTFASTTHAIVRNGLVPVFCDIDPKTYTMDASKIEALITPNTCAILPVHVYGNICDVHAIDDIAKRHELVVIYDAAHTFGETYEGVSTARFGDASCFSFHATKVFNSIEGGAVCFKDLEIGAKLYDLKNFGIHGPYEVSGVGANAKMNEFCAAMGICNLRHLDDEIAKREEIYNLYIKELEGIEGIVLNKVQPAVKSNYAYFPIVVDREKARVSRDDIFDALIMQDIYPRKYFYPLTSDFSCYEGQFDSSQTPIAQYVSSSVLTLPMYADLDQGVVLKVCSIIRNCIR